MRWAFLLGLFAAGCATVDYATLDADHQGRMAQARLQYDADAREAYRHVQAELAQLRDAVQALPKGELTDPVCTAERLQQVAACYELASCEAKETALREATEARYAMADAHARELGQQTLLDLAPSKRLVAYERILARSHIAQYRAELKARREAALSRYEAQINELKSRYAAAETDSDRLREAELATEEARVQAENGKTAQTVLVGVAATAAALLVIKSATSGGGSGYSAPSGQTKTLRICGYSGRALQGCCSWHGGVDVTASTSVLIMCNDGNASPTCYCH